VSEWLSERGCVSFFFCSFNVTECQDCTNREHVCLHELITSFSSKSVLNIVIYLQMDPSLQAFFI
jgi:DTW domain-containing protein YfiP